MIDLLASPQAMTATATEVAEIGLAINQADLAVAGPTTAWLRRPPTRCLRP